MPIRTIEGSTVVVTGASSGIGRATAILFSKAGAAVVLAARRMDRLVEVVDEIGSWGGEALAVRTDVAEASQVKRLIARAMERFGRVDTLVNNAGVTMGAPFVEQSMEDFHRVMDINFWGAVHSCREVVPIMRDQGSGVIMNVSSICGKQAVPFSSIYCSSKFALNGLTQSLYAELMSDNIAVGTIIPGAVETEVFHSFANQTGYALPENVPKAKVDAVALAILGGAILPRPEIITGIDAHLKNLIARLAPGLLEFVYGIGLRKADLFFPRIEQTPSNKGNLYEPFIS